MAVKRTIRLYRGDDWSEMAFRWLDSVGDEIPIASARMQFRVSQSSEEVQLTLTGGDGLVVDDATVTPFITAAQSAALASGVWDLEVTGEDDAVKTLAYGELIVMRDVTHD